MKEKTAKQLKLFIIYLLSYWLLSIISCLFAFGYDDSLRMLLASPKSDLSGALLFLSSFIAAALLFVFRYKTFSDQPYPYFIFGFYVGNVSLLMLFILDAFIRELIVWKFPEFLLVFISPFVELVLSYLFFGFAFLAIIPAVTSAFILYAVQKKLLLPPI
ncbi:TPA: hypothetical protein JAZ42_09445 [Legionella pneumophila]|uniref:hypothetical protein n=1 Tax=Legionella pneumophila TaxID=446 RepID=UPI00048EC42C|nr:hypothetical protein [Legionella pneumophila]RYB39785.1 hypothetical protein D7242_04015 [Legionella pneumophila]RYW27125.1 hypothetical protein D7234_08955 [Legionella pneumophila]HAT1868001.1 hypothetical protein [Legionella pneumophila]HAT1908131.1 hypothetical protein [Legionella pneumophila]HAT1917080.1 hypothetical protein [Legionella pneumophila]